MAQVRYERIELAEEDEDNEEIELHVKRTVHFNEVDDDDDVYDSSSPHRLYENRRDVAGKRNAYDEDTVVDNSMSTSTAHLPGNSRFIQMAVGTLASILLYLTLSICLTFYQKNLIQKMKFPFTIVSYHLVIKLILATCVRSIYKFRKGKTRVQLDWRTSVRRMAPTGIASGIDIGFSSWGLELVTISLYTMTKSSSIVFILFFAILLGLEKKSWLLVFTVGLIAAGLFMFTYKSTQFDALGFTFILVASLSSGVRWSLAQYVMQKSKLGLHNPIDMIFHMQPWMIASVVPFLAGVEGRKLLVLLRQLPDTPSSVVYMIILKVTFGAVVAFLMEVSEFLALSRTSGLTISIASIFKDVCQLFLAVEIDGDTISLINLLGLVVCIAGICCHVLHKYTTMAKLKSFEDDNDDEANVNNNISNGGITVTHHHRQNPMSTSMTATTKTGKHSAAQKVPLLEEIDSNESSDDADGPNSSDVIFDVLKRRMS